MYAFVGCEEISSGAEGWLAWAIESTKPRQDEQINKYKQPSDIEANEWRVVILPALIH